MMDSTTFVSTHRPALAKDEVRDGVALMMLKQLDSDPDSDIRYWSLGPPGCCAVQKPGFPIMLCDVDQAAVRRLMSIVDLNACLGVAGTDDTTRWFVDAARERGFNFQSG